MPVIKRYPNRKLYDTQAKQYVTLDGIADLIREGQEVQVTDHASGEDLTALTLTQIIFEQEKKQSGLLPHPVLTGLIRASGDRLTSLQRTLFSSTFWHQIDDEIKRRVQALIKLGEMTEEEGKKLLEQLLRTDIQPREEPPAKESGTALSVQQLEEYLEQRQLPTQSDLQQLYLQLDELAAKLAELEQSDQG